MTPEQHLQVVENRAAEIMRLAKIERDAPDCNAICVMLGPILGEHVALRGGSADDLAEGITHCVNIITTFASRPLAELGR